jgi:hypothetical protein
MYEVFRLKLAAGIRGLEFAEATPVDVARFEEWKGKLATEVGKARAYSQVFGEGRDTSRALTGAKADDRDAILDDVRTLVRVGRQVAEEVKELKSYWRVGTPKQADEDLLARGRRYVDKAHAFQQVFDGYGLTAPVLDAMTKRLDALESRIDSQAAARALHVGARAELPGIGRRMLHAMDALSAIYESAYADTPDKLAAWRSAINIAWPVAKARKPAPPSQEKGGVAT